MKKLIRFFTFLLLCYKYVKFSFSLIFKLKMPILAA